MYKRQYKALIPVNEDGEEESSEYVILKCSVDENGEDILETIEDDDEFDEIADIFDDEFSDILYDEDWFYNKSIHLSNPVSYTHLLR